MFGMEYTPSIAVLAIYAPIITIIGLSQVYGKSILYSTGHEVLMTECTFIGLVVYLLVGIPGVKFYSIIGGVIASLFAETAVTLSMILLGKSYHPCTLLRRENLSYVFASLLMGAVVYLTTYSTSSYALQLMIGIPVGVMVYILYLATIKNRFFIETKNIIIGYVRNR